MLVDPHDDREGIVRVIGIDPGTTTLGVGVIVGDLKNKKIISCAARTINAAKLCVSELDKTVHSDKYARIFAIAKSISTILAETQPIAVACESPFMSRRRPSAYGPLVEIIYAVRKTLHEYDNTMSLDLIDPPTAKIAVGAKGNSDKVAVLSAIEKLIKNNPDFQFDAKRSGCELKELDEHSSDAIAIAYWRWRIILENNFI